MFGLVGGMISGAASSMLGGSSGGLMSGFFSGISESGGLLGMVGNLFGGNENTARSSAETNMLLSDIKDMLGEVLDEQDNYDCSSCSGEQGGWAGKVDPQPMMPQPINIFRIET